jgi:uncharacterized membrane protein
MTNDKPKKLLLPSIKPDNLGLERMIFFSDAVFAIAVTLLALDIQLPKTVGGVSDAVLFQNLLSIWPKYLSYIISFMVIGFFWMGHHRKFRLIIRYDKTLLYLNHLMLMVVAFMPFSSSVISEYGNQTGTIFYALTLILMDLISAVIWYYASHNHRLIRPNLDPQIIHIELMRVLMVALVFIVSIGITWINNDLAKLSWILVAVVQSYYEEKSRKYQIPEV